MRIIFYWLISENIAHTDHFKMLHELLVLTLLTGF